MFNYSCLAASRPPGTCLRIELSLRLITRRHISPSCRGNFAGQPLARLVQGRGDHSSGARSLPLPDAAVDAKHAVAEASALVPKRVVCPISALQLHELTLQMPSAVWMDIDRTAWCPTIDYPPIRFVRSAGSPVSESVERHRIEGVEVPVTNPTRSIVDCIRYHAKVGLDVVL